MNRVKNRHGQDVELDRIKSVSWDGNGGCSIDREEGWGTFHLGADELDGFKPEVGDAIVMFTTNMSFIRGLIIENRVIRYMTAKQVEAESKAFKDSCRLRALEEYVTHGEALKARAAALPMPLRERMERFANDPEKGGVEFWVESAGYEMACLEGAAALLRKVEELGYLPNMVDPIQPNNTLTLQAIDWINDWWNINSDKHDPPYDYKKQMEIVPDFGDGHSGFTAGAAKSMAVAVLNGTKV